MLLGEVQSKRQPSMLCSVWGSGHESPVCWTLVPSSAPLHRQLLNILLPKWRTPPLPSWLQCLPEKVQQVISILIAGSHPQPHSGHFRYVKWEKGSSTKLSGKFENVDIQTLFHDLSLARNYPQRNSWAEFKCLLLIMQCPTWSSCPSYPITS